MSQENLLFLGIGITCIVGVIIVGFILFIKLFIEKKRREKKMEAESKHLHKKWEFEDALYKANTQNLEEARDTLVKAGVSLTRKGIEFPNVFWEVDAASIALSMITCAKLLVKEYHASPSFIRSELRGGLLSLAKTDLGKAIDISLFIGIADRGVAGDIGGSLVAMGTRFVPRLVFSRK